MFTKGFSKTAYDTAKMMKRAPILPSSSQANDVRQGMASGGPGFGQAMKNIWSNITTGHAANSGGGTFNTGKMGG
jgi:hypothetical protein